MEKEIGPETKLKIEMIDGDLHLSLVYKGKGLTGTTSVAVDSDYFVDALGELIPGETMLENISLASLKATLKGMKV